jgi:hypothetical protein
MTDPVELRRRRHRVLNLETRREWETFAEHREQTMGLILEASNGGRLAVLGAGNCNDLDLARSSEAYADVTLVDVDEPSVTEGVHRQGLAGRSGIRICPVDLSDLAATRSVAIGENPSARAIAEGRARHLGSSAFDVVASTCVLSQLVLSIVEQYGARHPRCVELVQFERALHLHLLAALLVPGGRALLISDLVSSDTAPDLLRLRPDRLPRKMQDLVARQNFFTGLNPYLIQGQVQGDPLLAERCEGVSLGDPWVWRLTARRGYLVFPITFTRR